jgi:hypothetical protein
MARIDQYARLIHHRLTGAGQQFTIPASADHTDETWAATDLYIGEIGLNITDDKVFARTNNGIIELAVATQSSSGDQIWIISGQDILVGASYSNATSVSKATGATSVSLGKSDNRWSGLFLGGNPDLKGTINTSDAIEIRDNAGNRFLTAGYLVTSEDSAIHIGTQSQTVAKEQGLFLNSMFGTMSNGGYNRVMIGSSNVIMDDAEGAVSIAAFDVQIGDSNVGTINGVTHIGPGYFKKNLVSLRTTVGGSFAVRTLDGGTLGGNSQPIYADSDWVIQQEKIQTLNALSTPIVTYGWTAGEAIQMKARVMGINRDDGNVYSAEIFGTGIHNGDGFAQMIGDPIILEQSNFGGTASIPPYDLAEATIECDDTNFYVKVKGHSASPVEWICTYSYQKMSNLFA